MRLTRQPLLLACLCLFTSLASGSVLGHARRQENTGASPATTTIRDGSRTSLAPAPTANTTTASSSITPTLAPTASSTGITFNDTMFNLTIPEGQLPLEPIVTPGWGVAGIILLGTGVVYALIGIKMKWLHTFFSTAYLGALGTAVLIVYVMTMPISDGIQGAYVVAVVLTGAILGGVAIIFKEITECLGCLLGGFCLSMWLLTLREGGLVTDTGAKAGFIAAFSAVAFALYFSRWTRTYALIGCTSFSGATAAVLGIDAFSRAGLKEFWAYIWSLNDRLFPIGATTYPLTKGMRVELAVTVVLFVAGVVSQLKLWMLIKQHREKREAEQLEARREMDEEEAKVGRNIERANARERRNWEAVYGDGPQQENEGADDPRPHASMDSGVGVSPTPSEKRMQSIDGPAMTGVEAPPGQPVEEQIEMVTLPPAEVVEPPKPKVAAEMVLAHDKECGVLTVQVAEEDDDELYEVTPAEEADESNVHPALRKLRRVPNGLTSTPEPVVVPLPFKIPSAQEPEGNVVDDDQSSVGALADDVDEETRTVAIPSKRSSLAKRLSHSSIDLLKRTLSQRSRRSVADVSAEASASREDLVVSRATVRSSVAATIDGMSSDGEDEDYEPEAARSNRKSTGTVEIVATLADKPAPKRDSLSPLDALNEGTGKHISLAETVSTSILDMDDESTSTAKPENDSGEATPATAETTEKADTPKAGASVASAGSAPVSLTKDRLPKAMSKVAMSYRTNEWAKHLSLADAPEPDTLNLPEASAAAAAASIPEGEEEVAAPVRVEELQLTAKNGAPQPAPMRPMSTVSSSARLSVAQELQPRSNSPSGPPSAHQNRSVSRRMSGAIPAPIVEHQAVAAQDDVALASRRASGSSSYGGGLSRTMSTTSLSPVPGVVSYSSPQTLIGQRDMLLRQKSGSLGFPASPEPIAYVRSHEDLAMAASASSPALHSSPYMAYPAAAAVSGPVETADDLPLSQRREIIRRQSSSLSLSSHMTEHHLGNAYGHQSPSLYGQASRAPSVASSNHGGGGGGVGFVTIPNPAAKGLPFNSHQPQRGSSHIPTAEARAAQLASFRSSVTQDLRASSAAGQHRTAAESMMDLQRSALLQQKEAEGQRREAERLERERLGARHEEMMRRGGMLDAHRDAIRRMQAGARDS